MSYWGRQNSWMFNGNFTDDTKPETIGYGTFFNAICGQPVDVDFISFDDIINGKIDIDQYDVLVNTGLEGSSFQGDFYWKNETLLTKIRRYVANGGGFLGIGNPSGYFYQGKYFQLADILGVEKELGFTYCKNKFFPEENKKHWIVSDIKMANVHFVPCHQMVYPTGAEVLSCALNENDPTQNTNQERAAPFIYPAYSILLMPSASFINPSFGPPIKKRAIKRRYQATRTSIAIITTIRAAMLCSITLAKKRKPSSMIFMASQLK